MDFVAIAITTLFLKITIKFLDFQFMRFQENTQSKIWRLISNSDYSQLLQLYDNMFVGRSLLTADALPLQNSLLHNQNTKIGKHGQAMKIFPLKCFIIYSSYVNFPNRAQSSISIIQDDQLILSDSYKNRPSRLTNESVLFVEKVILTIIKVINLTTINPSTSSQLYSYIST